MANNKSSKTPSKDSEVRLVDKHFAQYSEYHHNPTNRLIHFITIPLMVFGLFGLLWAIPFPHIGFLGVYNSYLNWASFLLAFSVYFYYKLSPMLSYFVLIILFAFSYGVIELAQWQLSGGPALWLICLAILILSLAGQYIGNMQEGKKIVLGARFKFLFIGPIWLLHLILKKLSIRY